jgi:hypothetical protein
MRANLKTTMDLYATAAGTQSGGSSLINKPGAVADSPVVRSLSRKRLVRTNPDIDAEMSTNETQQTDSAGFTGKRLKVVDTKYGHYVSEHDSSSSAQQAKDARPYSKVIRAPDWNNLQRVRNINRTKALVENEDGKT